VHGRHWPLPTCSDAQLFNGTYVLDGNASVVRYRWTPKHCALVRFTPTAARACMQRRRVVLVGDSRTRYQYMSLSIFLSHDAWLLPYDAMFVAAAIPEEDVTNEHQFRDWKSYYTHTNALVSVQNRTHELCDCFRPRDFRAHKTRENRFLYFDDDDHLHLAYFLVFKGPTTGHFGFPPFVAGRAGDAPLAAADFVPPCAVGECSQAVDWSAGEDVHFVRSVLVQLRPSDVFFSSGWRRQNAADRAATREALLLLHNLSDSRVYFKTSTVERVDVQPAEAPIDDVLTYDADALTRATLALMPDIEVFWDSFHFQPWVYEELNQVMLNQVCREHARDAST